ncbi:MAG: hypothetical protein WC551_10440 [Patescibacteria group bacterium]
MEFDNLPASQQNILRRLSVEFPYYAKSCLKIVTKEGEIVPFVLNKAQLYIHSRLEAQKARMGRVRAVILKGRQQGCTTLIQGRYFHRTQFKSNLSAYILAHQAESTLKIFGMAAKFYQNLPALKFPLSKDTEKSMVMENGSSYTVGTAGSAQVGRGMTVHLFHGSEVAFYENADELSTGLMQTVADAPGTEMIFESTANGPGNFFYNLVMGAISGKNGFELIFIPWYWQEEYKDAIPLMERELDEKEQKYYEAHKADGLTLHHLAWRRRKIESFGGPEKTWKFIQEYPFTPEEAFVRAEGRFFDIAKVYAATGRKTAVSGWQPLIVGVDQGRTGDPTKIRRRIGKVLLPIETIPADDGDQRDMRLAGRLARIIDAEGADMVFIDVTNEHGALDRLHELGYKKQVRGISFGEKAMDPERFRNKRVEMHVEFREWLNDPEAALPAGEQKFLSEVGSIPEEKETSNCVKYLVPKDDIKKDLGWSPDELDATVLTFAYPVKKKVTNAPAPRPQTTKDKKSGWRSPLATVKGVR